MYGNFYTISNHVWVVFEKKYPEDLEVYTPLGLQREEKDGQQEKIIYFTNRASSLYIEFILNVDSSNF